MGYNHNLPLSDIVNSTPRFSFFGELIDIPASNSNLLQHDFYRINKIIDDISGYLGELVVIFKELRNSSINMNDDLDWFYEGRDGIYDLIRNVESLDSIISQLLTIVDGTKNHANVGSLLVKFEGTSDLLLDVKKYLIVYKKKVDIAINFKELNKNIIQSLIKEMERCIKNFIKLLELKVSSPKRHLAKFNLEVITLKMRINSLTSTNISMRSLRLPTFNDLDEYLYNEYLSLESRIKPLKVSLDYLPLKIEEFNMSCRSVSNGNLFAGSIAEVDSYYKDLIKKWDYLLNELQKLKRDSLDTKWNEIFTYLINEIILKCDFLIETLLDKNTQDKIITDEIGSIYKLCSNSITLISKAFSESTIDQPALATLFNDNLLPKWHALSDMISNSLKPPVASIFPCNSLSGEDANNTLKTYHTIKRSPTPEILNKESFHKKLENGLGIDLGIDVASSNIPFSIQKKDRVRNYVNPSSDSGKNLKQSLMNAIDEDSVKQDIKLIDNNADTFRDDDEITLVNSKTPKLAFDMDGINHKVSKLKIHENLETENLWNNLLNTHTCHSSRIPIMVDDYIQLGLRVIKKVLIPNCESSRIPTISPNHPVFNDSPERQNIAISLKPPLFLMNRSLSSIHPSPTPTRSLIQSDDENIFRKPSRKPSIIRNISRQPSGQFTRPLSSLSQTTTPKLTCTQTPTYRSTSPDRPPSSIGSRFEDKHLIHPLKSQKPDWK